MVGESFADNFLAQLLALEAYQLEPLFPEAQRGLLDYLAVCAGALKEPSVQNLLAYAGTAQGAAPLIGEEKGTSPEMSALYNGFLGHYLDFDDVHAVVRGHPSTVLYPTLLALASIEPVSGKRFLAAYCIGVELMGRLARAVTSKHYERGFHNTATLGTIGGAVAGAFLLQLNHKQIACCLGLAAAQASGLRANFGTEGKPLQAGMAAQKAVQAVLLARQGMTGSLEAFIGVQGFMALFGAESQSLAIFSEKFGEQWLLAEQGLWFKTYPFCAGAAHTADAALWLKRSYDFALEEIDKVQVVFPPLGDVALVQKRPTTGEEGRFSAEYVATVGLAGLPYSLQLFANQPIADGLLKAMRKVERCYDANISPLPEAQPPGRFTIVKVFLKDGRVLEKRVDIPRGSPKRPLTKEELEEKLVLCAGKERAARLQHAVAALRSSENVQELFAYLR